MRLLKIEGANFKSLRDPFAFEFPKASGLYFMHGENRQSPAMGANAAGKSTLWDAVTWTLYGRTLRGLKASNLVSWGSSKSRRSSSKYWVRAQLALSGQIVTIMRQQTPNKILLQVGEGPEIEVNQDGLEAIGLLPYQQYTNALVFAQFGSMFLTLQASNKMALFSELLGLDDWLARSRNAGKVAQQYSDSLRDAAAYVRQAKAKLVDLQDRLDDLIASSNEWKAARKKEQDRRDRELVRLGERKRKLRIEEKHVLAHLQSLGDQLREAQAQKQHADQDVKYWDAQLSEKKKKVIAEESEIISLERKLPWLEEAAIVRNAVLCPTCNRILTQKAAKKAIERVRKFIADTTISTAPLRAARDEAEDGYIAAKDAQQKAANELQRVRELMRDKESDRKSLQRTLENVIEDIRTVSSSAVERNPFIKRIKTVRDRIQTAEKYVAAKARQVQYIERRVQGAKYWVQGFKDIRLQLTSEFLVQLQVEINRLLPDLGLADWRVVLDIEAETKAKTMRRALTVLVKKPDSPELVPFESWSGGESQRLILAGSMGLSNLVLARYGLSKPIEVWDEPSSYLSEHGILDLLEMLKLRARTERKQIWIVDHRTLEFGGFAGVLTAVKDTTGNTFLEYSDE